MNQEQIEKRLEELKQEYATGQGRMRELEVQQAQLQQTMLRISGAIQVLQEMVDGASSSPGEALPDTSLG